MHRAKEKAVLSRHFKGVFRQYSFFMEIAGKDI